MGARARNRRNIILLAFLLLNLVCLVTADYELSVTIYSYNNPENKCASCRDGILEAFGCCDNHALKNASECGIRTRTCEIVLSVCLRQPSNRYGDALCPNGNSLFKSDILQVTSFSPPLNISSKTDTLNSQLYITLNDDDFGDGFDLVDSFPTNLTTGMKISRRTLSGQFGVATIELELSLACTSDCTSIVGVIVGSLFGGLFLFVVIVILVVITCLITRKKRHRATRRICSHKIETSGEVVLPFLNEERQNVYEANENAML